MSRARTPQLAYHCADAACRGTPCGDPGIRLPLPNCWRQRTRKAPLADCRRRRAFLSEFPTRLRRTRGVMKRGRVCGDAGTEVGLSLVLRARCLVGPGVPRAPRIATPASPVSAHLRFRLRGLHASVSTKETCDGGPVSTVCRARRACRQRHRMCADRGGRDGVTYEHRTVSTTTPWTAWSWPTGSRRTAVRTSPWKPPASTGSPCGTCWRSTSRWSSAEWSRGSSATTPILIVDEPTAGLDAASEQAVISALDTLMKGRTSVVIAHHLRTIRHADIIFVMKDSELVEQGTHEALLAQNGVYPQNALAPECRRGPIRRNAARRVMEDCSYAMRTSIAELGGL